MGCYIDIFEVNGIVESNNTPKDDEDMELVNELRERLRAIVEEEKYRQIHVMIV
jgi:hypothetical protein